MKAEKWLEEDRSLSKQIPSNYPKGNFKAKDTDKNIRFFLSMLRIHWETEESIG